MSGIYGNASGSSSSSVNSSSHDTEDDHTIAAILAEDEKLRYDGKLGKMLSHLDSIPHTPRVIQVVPDAKDATLDHERLAERFAMYRLAEMQIEGDGNCQLLLQFRALADQLLGNQDDHKHVRKDVVKQLKRHKNLYKSYVPIEYEEYVRKMKSLGEWGDHVTLQAAADKFKAKICLVTSFRDACYIEILPKDITPSRDKGVVAELLE
ncbi:OVARIAN TUMOR DOMAIN-containing deubiquitinating enzyme 11 [Orobanche hederae]